jgi:hypothetical protein
MLRHVNARWLWLLVLSVAFFAVRAPFIDRPLRGEEGTHAAVMVDRPRGPDYCLIGRIGHEQLKVLFEHPALMYEALRTVGALASPILVRSRQKDAVVVPRLRTLFSLFEFSVVLLLGILLVRERVEAISWPNWLLFVSALSMPLLVLTSTEQQMDGSVGVFMNGLCALAIGAAGLSRLSQRSRLALLFAGAAILGCGKQEWSLALLGTVVAWVAYLIVTRQSLLSGILPRVVLALLCGLLIGNLVSFLYDPVNYRGGYRVMTGISEGHAVWKMNWASYYKVTQEREQWWTVHLVLMALLLVESVASPQRRPFRVLGMIFGASLFFGFCLTGWNSEARYYAPAAIVLLVTLLAGSEPLSVLRKWLWIAASVLLLAEATFRFHQMPPSGGQCQVEKRPCVRIINSGCGWNKDPADFIVDTLSFEDAARRAAKFNLSVCY